MALLLANGIQYIVVHTQAIRIGYIPAKRDVTPVISLGEGQCLSEAKGVPRVKPEAHRGFTKALAFPKRYNGSHILLAGTYLIVEEACLAGLHL